MLGIFDAFCCYKPVTTKTDEQYLNETAEYETTMEAWSWGDRLKSKGGYIFIGFLPMVCQEKIRDFSGCPPKIVPTLSELSDGLTHQLHLNFITLMILLERLVLGWFEEGIDEKTGQSLGTSCPSFLRQNV
jgi:hypothetical protein